MTASIATFQDMLKQQIEPAIQDQIEWQDVLLEDTANIGGINRAGIEVDMKNNKFEITSLNSGMTAYASSETGSLVTSDLSIEKMYMVPKYVRARSLMGHAAIQATIKDQAALERGSALYGMEIRRAMMRAKGRHIRGDGTGIIGVLAAGVVSSATHTIRAKTAGTIASNAKYKLGAYQMFMPGQAVEIGTETAFAAGTQETATILTVNSDTSITFTASKTLGSASGANNEGGTNADTWYFRLSGEYGVTPMGLLGLIDDGTLAPSISTIQSLTRATTPYMKSQILDKATAATIVKDFRDLYVNVMKYNRNVKYFVVSEDVYAKYTDSITITNQSNPGSAQYTSKLGTGHTGLMFAYGSSPIPIFLDTLLPYGTALLVDPDQLFCADLFKDDFVDGAVLARVSGTTNYETIRAAYYNFGTFSARKLGGQINYQSV